MLWAWAMAWWTATTWAQQTTTIRGRVTDEFGAPVPFARVSSVASGAETDENGMYAFSVARGDSLRIKVEALDYEPFFAVL
ncbi:MAG: carboxypeptidase-like regulatory domain-containing protein, partial [Bacteroidia bacterium]|nr:carboxypeptidase-like regulatory domain-containing protein [Bacteroidia bacterium]